MNVKKKEQLNLKISNDHNLNIFTSAPHNSTLHFQNDIILQYLFAVEICLSTSLDKRPILTKLKKSNQTPIYLK